MELKTPLRIYWDLPLTPQARCGHQEICAQVLALRVLALDLYGGGDSLPPQLWEVLKTVQGSMLSVTVSAPGAALTAEVRQNLRALGVRAVQLVVGSLQE